MTHGASSAPPSAKPTIIPCENPLLDRSELKIKDAIDYISNQPKYIPTITLIRDYSVLSTVQQNLATSHIKSSVTIFLISPPALSRLIPSSVPIFNPGNISISLPGLLPYNVYQDLPRPSKYIDPST